jgi:hypothetical protein
MADLAYSVESVILTWFHCMRAQTAVVGLGVRVRLGWVDRRCSRRACECEVGVSYCWVAFVLVIICVYEVQLGFWMDFVMILINQSKK